MVASDSVHFVVVLKQQGPKFDPGWANYVYRTMPRPRIKALYSSGLGVYKVEFERFIFSSLIQDTHFYPIYTFYPRYTLCIQNIHFSLNPSGLKQNNNNDLLEKDGGAKNYVQKD